MTEERKHNLNCYDYVGGYRTITELQNALNDLETEGIYIKSYSDLLAEARRYNQQFTNAYEEIHSLSKNDA